MNLEELGREAHEINEANGWDVFNVFDFPDGGNEPDVRKLCTHMALVHSEVSEATEAVRKRDFANFKEEMADVAIRVASICHGLGINLTREMEAKLAINRTRGLHHGGKAV